MDLIADLIAGNGPELIEQLSAAGLDREQAQGFLPEALQSLVKALQQLDLEDLMQADSNTQTSSLLDKIDITALADHLGGNSGLASSGLLAIIPGVLGFLQDNPAASTLLGMLNGADGSKLAGLARGLLH